MNEDEAPEAKPSVLLACSAGHVFSGPMDAVGTQCPKCDRQVVCWSEPPTAEGLAAVESVIPSA